MLCDIIWMTFHIKLIDINAAHVISMLKTQDKGWMQDTKWETLRYGSTVMEFNPTFDMLSNSDAC